VGVLDGRKGLLLQPVGKSLAEEGALLRHHQLFRGVSSMVQGLRVAHQLGWVHSDMSPGNLLAVGDPAQELCILDW
jgi:serine/threonine protein kinase